MQLQWTSQEKGAALKIRAAANLRRHQAKARTVKASAAQSSRAALGRRGEWPAHRTVALKSNYVELIEQALRSIKCMRACVCVCVCVTDREGGTERY